MRTLRPTGAVSRLPIRPTGASSSPHISLPDKHSLTGDASSPMKMTRLDRGPASPPRILHNRLSMGGSAQPPSSLL